MPFLLCIYNQRRRYYFEKRNKKSNVIDIYIMACDITITKKDVEKIWKENKKKKEL